MRDLDEDQSTGKIQPDAYEQERQLWAQRGVQILKALDELSEEDAVPLKVKRGKARDGWDIDAAIEAAVAAYLDDPVVES